MVSLLYQLVQDVLHQRHEVSVLKLVLMLILVDSRCLFEDYRAQFQFLPQYLRRACTNCSLKTESLRVQS